MLRKSSSDVEELLERSRTDVPRPANTPEQERRYVFNGDARPASMGFAIRQNKRGTRRKISTFNIILLLFGFGVASVFYISNIIAVNQLAVETGQLQTRLDKIENTNALLRAEVTRKSGRERIGKIATEQLGLKYPKEQPTWFEIDNNKLESITSE
jgi:cell division protein FtsL